MMPRAVEASEAVPRPAARAERTAAAVVDGGTVTVAVMRTLAAATLIATSEASTPASEATLVCRADVSW